MKSLREKYELMVPELDERGKRLWAATEALAIGRGGIVTVAKATGLAESTIRRPSRVSAGNSRNAPSLAATVRRLISNSP